MRKKNVRVEPVLTLEELTAGQREIERQAERTVALLTLRHSEASEKARAAYLEAEQQNQLACRLHDQLRESREYLKNLRGVHHA